MRIRNAYVVHIDFDSDISSSVEGYYVFAGEEAFNEVKKLVRQALKDMNTHVWKRGRSMSCDIDDCSVPVEDVIDNDEILAAYIEWGNSCFGNWTIEVNKFD